MGAGISDIKMVPVSGIKMVMVWGRVFQISKWYRYQGGGGGFKGSGGGGETKSLFFNQKTIPDWIINGAILIIT